MNLRPRVVPLLILTLAGCGEPPPIEGTWEGFVPGLLGGQDARVRMAVEEVGDGAFEGTLEVRELPVIGAPVEGRVDRDGTVRGSIDGVGTFTGRVGEELRLDVRAGEALPEVVLRQDDPTFVRFDVPRVEDDGSAVQTYAYAPPEDRGDGLAVGHLEDHGMAAGPIEDLVGAILSGSFPRADGLLIVKDGTLVLEEYFYGHDAERLHAVQSVTKSVLGLLIGQAITDGHIEGTSAPVHAFFPDYAGTPWIDDAYPITVGDALSMSAGLAWEESLSYLDPDNPAVFAGASEDPLAFIFDRPTTEAPGTSFSYNSGLSMVLGALLERATGTTVEAYAQRRLFEPLGIDAAYWRPLGTGPQEDAFADTGGGLFLTGRDLAKLGMLMLEQGTFEGQQVVDPAWVDAVAQPQAPGGEFGYQWWRVEYELGGLTLPVAYASGFGGQRLWVVPGLDVVIVQTALDFEGEGANPEAQVETYIVPALLGG